MMENDRRKIYTVVAIVAVVAVLFSCLAGALAGGVAGLVVGRRQSERVLFGVMERWEELRGGVESPTPRGGEPSSPWEDPRRPLPFELPAGMEGALVVDVIAGTPAEEAGLLAGDIVVAVDQIPIDANHPLPDVIETYEAGDRITVRIWRSGAELSVQAKLGENPDAPGQAYLGVYFEMVESLDWQLPQD
jgi:S1-C subfamily serine protease